MTPSKGLLRFLPPTIIAIGAALAATCALLFPAVEGLGTKVRLPVFHGGMTWVNLAAFSVVALLALVHLVTGKPAVYAAEEGMRWVAIPMWLVGSALGLLAALNTWDFTGSQSSPLEVAMDDPRLVAQFWILLAALGIAALGLVIDEKKLLSGADVAFVAFMWAVILQAVLGPGRALHPDSPVMNSDEIFIKLMFFGIVGGIGLAASGAAWWIARVRGGAKAPALDSKAL